jgi:hypothetical protein
MWNGLDEEGQRGQRGNYVKHKMILFIPFFSSSIIMTNGLVLDILCTTVG